MVKKDETGIQIDLWEFAALLWYRAGYLVCSGLLGAVLMMGACVWLVTPMYQSETVLYLHVTDLTAAQSLTQTAILITEGETTLEQVAEEANTAYSPKELRTMLTASGVKGTPALSLKARSHNPEEAAAIAEAAGNVLAERMQNLTGGSFTTMEPARVPTEAKFPSYPVFGLLGAAAGMVLYSLALFFHAWKDDRLSSPKAWEEAYGLPILGEIPGLLPEEKPVREPMETLRWR